MKIIFFILWLLCATSYAGDVPNVLDGSAKSQDNNNSQNNNNNGIAITGSTVDASAIGATTPASGAFTSLSASGAITPSSTAGIIGTTTNDNANAGSIGEIIVSIVPSGNAVSLGTAAAKTIASLSATPGDWDCSGTVDFALTGATSTLHVAALSLADATIPGQAGGSGIGPDASASVPFATTTLTNTLDVAIAPTRLSISNPVSLYLVAQATFTLGSEAAYGTIRCRRMR